MGYFPNGTSAEIFECKFCQHCVNHSTENGEGCAVYGAHLIYNYDQHDKGQGKLKGVLDMLIDENDVCQMFKAQDEDRCTKTLELFEQGC